ncbi:MAG: hypothetical protein ACYCXG_12125 [Acidiferrobacter sp.]
MSRRNSRAALLAVFLDIEVEIVLAGFHRGFDVAGGDDAGDFIPPQVDLADWFENLDVAHPLADCWLPQNGLEAGPRVGEFQGKGFHGLVSLHQIASI